jgi:hypothetical protein
MPLGVAPARNIGIQRPWMVLMYFKLLNHHEGLASPRQMKDLCRADKVTAASANAVKGGCGCRLIHPIHLQPRFQGNANIALISWKRGLIK